MDRVLACVYATTEVPTKLYFEKERSGHDASKFDVAPELGEPKELDLAQKIAEVGVEKCKLK